MVKCFSSFHQNNNNGDVHGRGWRPLSQFFSQGDITAAGFILCVRAFFSQFHLSLPSNARIHHPLLQLSKDFVWTPMCWVFSILRMSSFCTTTTTTFFIDSKLETAGLVWKMFLIENLLFVREYYFRKGKMLILILNGFLFPYYFWIFYTSINRDLYCSSFYNCTFFSDFVAITLSMRRW